MVKLPVISSIQKILEGIPDPEIPVLSITDLGIVRRIEVEADKVSIHITPTYSGCPAMDMIATNIRMELLANGFTGVHIIEQLEPAWTTDWMSAGGKAKLKEYGIAPPQQQKDPASLFGSPQVNCPLCGSANTTRISEFGSTACKSLFRCEDCLEPFDYFKCH